jgi:flagellar basal body-associated protein FliL
MSETATADAASAAPKKALPIGVILGALNVVAVLGVAGLIYYTRVLHKRPPITEIQEREKVLAQAARVEPADRTLQFVKFEPMTVNLKSTDVVRPSEGSAPSSYTLHYANFAFTVQAIGSDAETRLNAKKTEFIDELLRYLGNTSHEELSTVQGRYILRTEMAAMLNRHVTGGKREVEPIVLDVFFTEFTVQ